MLFTDNLRRNLRRFLDRKRMTLRAFAAASGVHRVTLSNILNGHLEPSLTLSQKIAEATGLRNPEDIFKPPRRAA